MSEIGPSSLRHHVVCIRSAVHRARHRRGRRLIWPLTGALVAASCLRLQRPRPSAADWNGWNASGVTDWDGDGHQDIITRQNATGDLWLYPGESRRGPTTTQRVQIGIGW
jgi:hypothetical protein